MAESKPLVGITGIAGKRKRGRPVGSTNKATIISQIESLLKRIQHVPVKRGRGRPRIIRPQVVEALNSKLAECARNNLVEHNEAARKESIKISRREGLVRPRESADVMVSERGAGPHPFLPEKAVKIQVGCQVPIYNPNLKKKYLNEKGKSPRTNILVKKKLQASLVNIVGIKRGRGRPRKNTTSIGIVSSKLQNKMKTVELPSETIGVEKKRGRGRPRKAPPVKIKQDQVAVFSQEMWNGPVQYEQCEEMDRFHSPTDIMNSYRPKNPAEMPVSSPEHSQIRQEASSPSVDLHGDWVNGEMMNKDEDPEQRTEYHHPYWVTKTMAPQWTPETAEYADDSMDNNSMSQWAVENTAISQVPQYLGESASEQLNYQEDLLQGLADFKTQLVNELAATRAEIREGAQLLRSAISAVSSEIHQLGQILQPLVSVVTSSIVSQPGNPAAFVSRPPQDTPPDDRVNNNLPSRITTSSPLQDKACGHSVKSPTGSLSDEICVVKMEDAMDSSHEEQSAVSSIED